MTLLQARRWVLAATVLAAVVWAGSAHAGPSPDPAPGTKGRVTYVAYWYWTSDRRDGVPVLCYVPARGERRCVRVVVAPRGAE